MLACLPHLCLPAQSVNSLNTLTLLVDSLVPSGNDRIGNWNLTGSYTSPTRGLSFSCFLSSIRYIFSGNGRSIRPLRFKILTVKLETDDDNNEREEKKEEDKDEEEK